MPITGTFGAGSARGFGKLSTSGSGYSGPTPEYWWRADSGLSTSTWTAYAGGLNFTLNNVISADSSTGVLFNGSSSFGNTANLSSNIAAKHIFIRYDAFGFPSDNIVFLGHSTNSISEIYFMSLSGGFSWYHVENNGATLNWASRKTTPNGDYNNIAPTIVWSDFGNGTSVQEDNDTYYTDVLNFTGASLWSKPAGVTTVIVECWGAGGGGGAATVNNSSGGGGAGGQYSRKTLTYSSAAQSILCNIGLGGAGSTTGTGSTGGDTTWDTNVVVAKGGAGGTGNNTTLGAGGGVASTTGGVGDVVYAGTSGGGLNVTAFPGGYGGTGAGSNGSPSGNGSPATEYGGVGGVGGASDSSGTSAPSTGGYGGGGGGGNRSTIANGSGGNGANGTIRVSYPTVTTPNVWTTYTGTFLNAYNFVSGSSIQLGRRTIGTYYYGYIKEVAIFTTNLTQTQGIAFKNSMLQRWPKLGPI